mmetsp:Transcript_58436/g.132300  ORF Transcript_58436/g.132300 Transcript_58436/m.132300 type:complete len:411 (+) Transcript_58436:418-1650(+)|eukprot:CAMPEP_0172584842 /NCGR_PEP_ID=MMETSP1068-20121228/4409_1 /TAXON_ID=35684 /ORGANISM="Pseudopedinella elastica, Strain CCMP716" /LENGTH=410 /DNA_ID=CAMNT_0013379151 /DNA_START=418 /DNA_END=1650 /DNA_ORIENTATION=+
MDLDLNVLGALAAAFVLAAIFLRPPRPKEDKLYPIILGFATGNPPYRVSQQEAAAIAEKAPGVNEVKPLIQRIYGNGKISHRYMAVPDFTPSQALPGDELFFPPRGENGRDQFKVPVQERLDKFREKAVPLVVDVCRRAAQDAGVSLDEIGKLVVVSSTGFIGPGLDCHLIDELGLRRDVDRALIGFMGCAAAMNGFRVGMDYCRAKPGKLALVCCVELSSVHTTFDDNVNDAILHAIFGDGCAATILGARTAATAPKGSFAIIDDHAWLMEGTEDGITLAINMYGISCTLSKYLPQYIAKNMKGYVETFLGKHGLEMEDMDFWAVHPGGRRIIEEAQNGLGLSEEQCKYSWQVLDQYGNMLSPSVMFVLDLIMKDHKKALARGEAGFSQGLAFSFSPGVGAEGIFLKVL